MAGSFASDDIVTALKAAAEPTRLRILLLLAAGELSVKDLTVILGQSQPRISRHLKLLAEAGLVERFREGSWAYFTSPTARPAAGWRSTSSARRRRRPRHRPRPRARRRPEAEREATAQTYFQSHAADWDRIRALHIAEHDVEQAIVEALGAARSSCWSTSAPEPGACSSCSPTATSAASASISATRCSPMRAAISKRGARPRAGAPRRHL